MKIANLKYAAFLLKAPNDAWYWMACGGGQVTRHVARDVGDQRTIHNTHTHVHIVNTIPQVAALIAAEVVVIPIPV